MERVSFQELSAAEPVSAEALREAPPPIHTLVEGDGTTTSVLASTAT
jgi:hypothetical protein